MKNKGDVGRIGRKEFALHTTKKARTYHGPAFSISITDLENQTSKPLFTSVVSKKVKKDAAGRNLIKRRIREATIPLLRGQRGISLVVRAKGAAAEMSFLAIKEEISSLFARAAAFVG